MFKPIGKAKACAKLQACSPNRLEVKEEWVVEFSWHIIKIILDLSLVLSFWFESTSECMSPVRALLSD